MDKCKQEEGQFYFDVCCAFPVNVKLKYTLKMATAHYKCDVVAHDRIARAANSWS